MFQEWWEICAPLQTPVSSAPLPLLNTGMVLPKIGESPKISVVTVSFNQGSFIRENIESVLAQNYSNFEHIIIDAGSTDETLSILEEYDHLNWVSEPDRGQTHGLNKGFRKAAGEIIGWLNSDDRYAPGIFPDVAQGLQEEAVVLGACEFTDKEGNVTETVPNTGRNWFDIWKYWIYHSSPAQPSIFFRREALHTVALGEGYFLDESLHFTMDYELWLRLAARYPFRNQAKKTFAYFRMYDQNKTGADAAGTYREAARIFKRYNLLRSGAERTAAIVLPVEKIDAQFEQTLESCLTQQFRSFEVIAAATGEAQEGKALKKYMGELAERTADGRYRFVDLTKCPPTKAAQIQTIAGSVNAPLFFFLQPGETLEPTALIDGTEHFEQDSLAALMLCGGDSELFQGLVMEREGSLIFNLEAVFLGNALPSTFLFRTLAVRELKDSSLHSEDDTSLRQLIALLQYKAWSVRPMESGIVKGSSKRLTPNEETPNERIQAVLVDTIASAVENDPFAAVRREHGFIIEFPPETVEAARTYLRESI